MTYIDAAVVSIVVYMTVFLIFSAFEIVCFLFSLLNSLVPVNIKRPLHWVIVFASIGLAYLSIKQQSYFATVAMTLLLFLDLPLRS